MRLRFSTRTLLIALLLAAIGIVVYQQTIGRDPIRRSRDFTWYENGVGVAERVHTGAWDSHDVIYGPGTHLTLYESDFDTRTFDRGGNFRASLQMPKDPKVGDVLDFTPIPRDRVSVTIPSEFAETYTFMLPGEFTAFQFGNPRMDWMPSNTESNARIKILSMTASTVRIHVKMRAVLPEFVDLELDREFTVARYSTKPK